MIRFNKLKIYLLATEAKPGGIIGAMLSPYLFSTNMSDFCKKFNDQSKDFLNTIWLPVVLFCDIIEKSYTFIIKPLCFTMFYIYNFSLFYKLDLIFIYDLVLFYSKCYKLDLYNSALIVFSTLKSFKRRRSVIQLSDFFLSKISD